MPYCTTNRPYKPEPPLKSQGELAVGYGSWGVSPFTYLVPLGRDLDVGFLKIYLTTEAVDLSDIQQSSPFHETRRSAPVWHPRPQNLLGTILIPIIQRRHQTSS